VNAKYLRKYKIPKRIQKVRMK